MDREYMAISIVTAAMAFVFAFVAAANTLQYRSWSWAMNDQMRSAFKRNLAGMWLCVLAMATVAAVLPFLPETDTEKADTVTHPANR
jgi:hypothetical protein